MLSSVVGANTKKTVWISSYKRQQLLHTCSCLRFTFAECVASLATDVLAYQKLFEHLARISTMIRKNFLLRAGSSSPVWPYTFIRFSQTWNDLMILWPIVLFPLTVPLFCAKRGKIVEEKTTNGSSTFFVFVVNFNTKFTFNGKFVCCWCDVHAFRLWCIFLARIKMCSSATIFLHS